MDNTMDSEQQQQDVDDEEVDAGDSFAECDESKCVSRSQYHIYIHSFTCYHDGCFPSMCADGFLPVTTNAGEAEGLSHFTCCPPDSTPEESTVDTTARPCSDPITVPVDFEDVLGDLDAIACDGNDVQIHARQMKTFREGFASFVCCDSPLSGNLTTDYLETTECVPYRNELYEAAIVKNKIGKLDVVYCDLEDFQFARPYGTEISSDGRYQCCKTGPSLPPFVKDFAFGITVYTVVALFAIAAFLSAIVAIGLTIPLCKELSRKRRQSLGDSSTERFGFSIFSRRFSAFRRFSSSSEPVTSSRHTRDRSRDTSQNSYNTNIRGSVAARKQPPRYSSYNLYLVYLALLDLIYCSVSIWEYQRYINQTFDPSTTVTIAVSSPSMKDLNTPRDEPVIAPYMTANQWINAIICHQILVLLRTSYSARRINQPSLTRVNLQAGGVCLASAIFEIVLYYVYGPAWEDRNNGDFEKVQILTNIVRPIIFLFSIGIPVFYVLYVAILIWCKGYMPKANGASARKKAMRELSFYFFRIVAVFIGVWIPRGFFIYWADYTGQKWADLVAQIVVGLQPILTTGLILTKSDARRYIWDLVTLSYLFGNCKKSSTEEEQEQVRVESNARTGTGFSINENGEANGEVEQAAEREEEEAADSLIYSVLGLMPNDEGKSSDTKPGVVDAVDNAVEDNNDDDIEEVPLNDTSDALNRPEA